MTSPLRRKRRTTAHGRSTPARMLASALGLGLFLVGGAASAQTWAPSTSPYGTWRQPVPASKPIPNSWREGTKASPSPAEKDTTAPLPPTPPVEESAPLPAATTPEPTTLPPLPPPPGPSSTKQPAVIPVYSE